MNRPSYVEKALNGFAPTLDETYERMLSQIDGMYREEVLRALRWLAFTAHPMTIAQLNEICLIDLEQEDLVDVDNRGPWEDILNGLRSLILIVRPEEYSQIAEDDVQQSMLIRLAHVSVQEYLVSDRIQLSGAANFALRPQEDRTLLLKTCVAYLRCCVRIVEAHEERSLDRLFRLPSKTELLLLHHYPLFAYMTGILSSHLSANDKADVEQAFLLLNSAG
jgi:hypothetical protein